MDQTIPTGNYSDKYDSGNPVVRRLVDRFLSQLESILDDVSHSGDPLRVLEVGCGEGEITTRLHRRWSNVTGFDLPDASLRESWQELEGPSFVHGDAERLPFADGAFDLVVCVEVLEHLQNPEVGLAELARVTASELIASVPREPWFRLGNLAAGRYVRAWGNTPGHFNHWTSRAFLRSIAPHFDVRGVLKPFPWTLVHATSRRSPARGGK